MESFVPPRLLRGPHLQSVLASSVLRRSRVRRHARRLLADAQPRIADCGDGVRLLLKHNPPLYERGRVAILIHGWEGSADSTYLLAAATRLSEAGYHVWRVNLRDHGDTHHLNRELFHSCRLDEVIGAVRWVRARFPEQALFLGGYSLGGNFALRVAASPGGASLQLAAVAAVCPVLDPADTMRALDGGWPGYRAYFIRKWRRSLESKRQAFPAEYRFGDLRRFRTLEQMTDFFVREFTEYPDLSSYLKGYALTGARLEALQVPSVMLLAEDDPVIPVSGLESVAHPSALRIERAAFGGHCGFLGDYLLGSALDDYPLRVFDSWSG